MVAHTYNPITKQTGEDNTFSTSMNYLPSSESPLSQNRKVGRKVKNGSSQFCFCFLTCSTVIELRTLGMLGKCSTSGLYPRPSFSVSQGELGLKKSIINEFPDSAFKVGGIASLCHQAQPSYTLTPCFIIISKDTSLHLALNKYIN